jgi:restriction system protein
MSNLYGLLFFMLLLGLLAKFIRKHLLSKIKGGVGERLLSMMLKRKLDAGTYRILDNLTLPASEGTTQIDHVVVSRYGIFVIETKTYQGWIFGSERDAQWTQMIHRRKYRFQNPLRQNYKHTKTLSDLTGIPHDLFKSLVLFSGNSTFKTDMPENVLHFRDAPFYIKDHQIEIIPEKQVDEIVSVIREWTGTVTSEQKRSHVKNLKAAHRFVSAEQDAPRCPRCGQDMILRKRRNDSQPFWGCSEYPKCRGIRDAAAD